MTAHNVVQFCLLLLGIVHNQVLAHKGGRDGEASLGIKKAIELLESVEKISSQDLKDTNIAI